MELIGSYAFLVLVVAFLVALVCMCCSCPKHIDNCARWLRSAAGTHTRKRPASRTANPVADQAVSPPKSPSAPPPGAVGEVGGAERAVAVSIPLLSIA